LVSELLVGAVADGNEEVSAAALGVEGSRLDWVFSMIRLTASVPPLEERWVSNRARTCSRHIFRVRPRRATWGIGHCGKEAMTCSAIRLPSAGVEALYMERSCLVGVPGQRHLPAGVAGHQADVELDGLPFVEVFAAAAQQPSDLVLAGRPCGHAG
jgi:hypothetical protein